MSQTKRCGVCKEYKPLDEFSKNRARSFGRSYACKPCNRAYLEKYRKTPAGILATERAKSKCLAQPGYWRNANLKSKFGITADQWDALLSAQGYKCAICKATHSSGRGWHTDHCHSSERVRGILCHNCNVLLGHAKESTGTLKSAIAYLESHLP